MKRKLLFVAALAVSVLGFRANAKEDVTYLVQNADLSSLSGWTCEKYTAWGKTVTDEAHVRVLEFWSGTGYTDNKFKISQSVQLPQGYYRLVINAFYRNGGEGDGTNNNVSFFANAKSDKIYALNNGELNPYAAGGVSGDEYISGDLQKASNAFFCGEFKNEFDFQVTTDDPTEIGIEGENFTNNSWCIFGPVTLYKYTAEDYMADYRTKATEAKGLYESQMDGSVLANLKEAAGKEEQLLEDNDIDAVIEATNVLSAAIEAAKKSIAEFVSLKEKFDAVKELVEQAKTVIDDKGNKELLDVAIDETEDDFSKATTTSEADKAIELLRSAMLKYIGEAELESEDEPLDLTFLLPYPDVTDIEAWKPAPEGWYTEQTDGNFQVMNNDSKDAADGIHKKFVEYWSKIPKSNEKFNLYTQTTLPAGTYTMTCYAFAVKEDNYVPGDPNPGVYFYANDTQGSLVNSDRLKEQEISFINDKQQDVKIGLKPAQNNNYNWMGIGYVKLYKVPAKTTTYALTVEKAEDATVTVTVDGEEATEALELKTVNISVTTNEEDKGVIVTAAATEGETPVAVANNGGGLYSFQMPAYAVTIIVETYVNKSKLEAEITIADEIDTENNVGTSVFQKSQAGVDALTAALNKANEVNDSQTTTQTEVNTALAALKYAEDIAINAPDAKKPYTLKLTDDGFDYKDNATEFIKGAQTEQQGLYAIKYSRAYNANLAIQHFYFEAVDGGVNLYNIWFTDNDGEKRYICTATGMEGANTGDYGIRTTTNGNNALTIKVIASDTEGITYLWNTKANQYIGSNGDEGMYTDVKYHNFFIEEAEQSSVEINIEAEGYATAIFPFTPSLPTDIVVYAEEIDEENAVINLTAVATPEANVPYVLKNTSSATINETLTGLSTATAETYASDGGLVGVYVDTQVPEGSYVLQKQNAWAFYKVGEGTTLTAKPNKAYLTLPEDEESEAKVYHFNFNNATIIQTIPETSDGAAQTIYNLAGQRVANPTKGIYIVNGQKVLVK